MTTRRNITIGMLTYNDGKYVEKAIDSILRQTYKDFDFILIDDYSTDDTYCKISNYSLKDKRIKIYRNEYRLGYIENSIKCFRLADSKTDYFAWAAGHDIYDQDWLKSLVSVLDDHSEAVLAYPVTVRISGSGKKLPVPSVFFETDGMNTESRMKKICFSDRVGFGNMIYGLFRAKELRKIGIFPSLLMPDMLLLCRLSMNGTFIQVEKKLWFRRFYGLFSIDRQKKNIFVNKPWFINFPWPIVNSMYLLWNTVLSPQSGNLQNRKKGYFLTKYFFLGNIQTLKIHYPKIGKFIYRLYLIPHSVKSVIKSLFNRDFNH
jgi:glycosyltransferase involved in cell wall biosynthesis